MGANDAGMQRACAEGPSVHAPNPNQEEAFPLLVIDVRNGVNNPPRLELMRKTANSTSTANSAAIQLDTCIVKVSKNWFVVVGTCQK